MSDSLRHAAFLYRLARSLHQATEWQDAVSAAAFELSRFFIGSSVLLFLIDPEGKELQCVHPLEGVAVEGRTTRLDQKADPLVQIISHGEPRRLTGRDLVSESFVHLRWKGETPPSSIIIVPLRDRGRIVGALEVVRLGEPGADPPEVKDDPPAKPKAGVPGSRLHEAEFLEELGALLGRPIRTLRRRARSDLGQLEALTRVTRLYAVGRALHSSLEMEELAPLVASRAANLLQVEQCNVWLLEGEDSLVCAAAWGPAAEAVHFG